MPATIWKFVLSVTDRQVLELPINAKILRIGVQNNVPCMWAMIPNPRLKTYSDRIIYTFGTGHSIFDEIPGLKYLDTYLLGDFVFHVFEDA